MNEDPGEGAQGGRNKINLVRSSIGWRGQGGFEAKSLRLILLLDNEKKDNCKDESVQWDCES